MNELPSAETLREAKRLLAGGKRKPNYLHVSVLVKAPTDTSPAMRTPIGKGATARKRPQLATLGTTRTGAARRQRLRLERLAREELARAVV